MAHGGSDATGRIAGQSGTYKNQAIRFFGDGDFGVVRSSTVQIQGRFLGPMYTEGLSATRQIVAGVPFLNGHKILVGSFDTDVLTVDFVPVMLASPVSTQAPASP